MREQQNGTERVVLATWQAYQKAFQLWWKGTSAPLSNRASQIREIRACFWETGRQVATP